MRSLRPDNDRERDEPLRIGPLLQCELCRAEAGERCVALRGTSKGLAAREEDLAARISSVERRTRR